MDRHRVGRGRGAGAGVQALAPRRAGSEKSGPKDSAGPDNSIFDRVSFECIQLHELQHGDMARLQHHRTGLACFKRLGPAPHTNAPAIAGRQAGEIVFGARRDEVVALQCQIVEKGLGDLTTDGVQSAIFRAGATITIAVKPGHGRLTAAFQFTA